jgi:hypothetical protein
VQDDALARVESTYNAPPKARRRPYRSKVNMLAHAPVWVSALVMVVVPTLVAMAGPIVVRRYVGLERLSTNNEVAGFKFATVGVLYAVLLAFVVIVVWEKFSDSEADVSREAGAAATIYRLVGGIAQGGPALRDGMTAYLNSAITDDWAAMDGGKSSPATTDALNALYAAALDYRPSDSHGEAVMSEILHQLNTITEARRARLVKASGIVPGVIWLVLFGGAVLTIGFTFFFGTMNLRAQAVMTGALAMLIFSGLLVIVTIDHPFTGAVKVTPEALLEVIHDLARARARAPSK